MDLNLCGSAHSPRSAFFGDGIGRISGAGAAYILLSTLHASRGERPTNTSEAHAGHFPFL
jgi:hypothetical protein